MFKTKKILSAMLALALVLSLAAPLAALSEETTLKHYGDVRLTMLFVWNGGKIAPDDTYNNDVAKAIREKIGVTVEIEGIMMSETEKLNLIFASGDMPDILEFPFWGGSAGETGVIKKAANEGMLLPLDDVIGNYPNLQDAWDVGVISQKFLEADLNDPLFNGKKYVIPNETPGSIEDITHWAYGVFVRSDIAEALGTDLSAVKTPDDVYNFLKAIKDGGFKDLNGNDVIPASSFHNGWGVDQLHIGFEQHPYFTDYRLDADGNVSYRFLEQPYLDEVLFVRKLVAEGLLDKECFTTTDTLAEQKTANGTVAVQTAQYSVSLNAMKKLGTWQTNPEIKYTPVGPLAYGDGTTKVQSELNGRNGTHGIAFPITNKNLEASLAWFDYINSKEGVILTEYGFEGDTFYFNEAGQPRWTDELIAGKAAGDEAQVVSLRNRGIRYYNIPLISSERYKWFGETEPGNADAEEPLIVEYKKLSPIKLYDGYPLSALFSTFDRQEEFNALMAGERERVARESAYFAETDEGAIAIIEEYRNYLLTGENGVLPALLQYVQENLSTREDWVF
ncbi:MAG: extracellular solute-binding protein [Oscillospiraceae bacterium]|jgi:putative aldouronate transport system substrate-binding protein|nr:extracellular solute-binding protein [Oscillospiraceae bacterium]